MTRLRNLVLASQLFAAALLHAPNARSQTLPDSVKRLLFFETQANPMDTRSPDSFKVEHFEIPLDLVKADLAEYMSPEVRDALVFEKPGRPPRKFVRWIINPDDSKFAQQTETWLKEQAKQGDFDPSRKTHFTGYRTSSASMIVSAPNGAVFSVKVSTNSTGGKWQDKELTDRHAKIGRGISDFVHRHHKDDRKVVFQYETAGFGLPDVAKGMTVRELADVAEGKRYAVPGFAFMHETEGPKLAKGNGHGDPIAMAQQNVATALGQAEAYMLAELGTRMFAPHGQNFLIEMDRHPSGDLRATGRVIIRDMQDLHFFEPFFKNNGDFGREIADFPKRLSENATIAIGLTHETKRPSWLSGDQKVAIDAVFVEAFRKEYSRMTGIPIERLKKAFTVYEETNYSLTEITPSLLEAASPCYQLLRLPGT
jgi:hypothetical protein